MAYATTLQVFDFLRWTQQIPNYPTSTTLETVDSSGTLASGSKIYLDNKYVIAGTYTISYGATASSVTALTETTHYTIDKDIGEITITAAGAAAITTNSVFAKYKYNQIVPDSLVSDIITRLQAKIEEMTHRVYGTITLVTREESIGRGRYSRLYKPRLYPPYIVKTQLATAVSTTDGTEFVFDSTSGMSAGDYLTINEEVLLIDSVDDTTTLTVTRGALDSTESTHAVDDWAINVAVEISNTEIGYDPSWSVIGFRDDFDVDSDTGAVQLLHINPERKDDLSTDVFPPHQVFNRLRMTYKYGTSSVPSDITQATILLTAYELTLSAIGKALPEGINGFNPSGQALLKEEAEKIISEHRHLFVDCF